MPSPAIARFIEQLLESERTNRPEPVASLFSDGARLERPAGAAAADQQPPLEFWRTYLGSFENVASEFTRITESDGFASLEWISHATLPGGREITYRGVTLLDIDGDRLAAMRTYYDSAPLLPTAPVPAPADRSHPGRQDPAATRPAHTGGRRGPVHPASPDPAEHTTRTGGRKGSPTAPRPALPRAPDDEA